ncbi:MAG TPA: FtsQ-type POTRA domain-containing protein [Streptosporangiaceae bacterium]|nr:FtsQ-type POTRA domain-containing protein [Streptosporangiaceae bacterium]
MTGPGTAAGPSGAGTAAAPAPAATRAPRGPARRGDPWRTAFVCVLALAILVGAVWALLGSSLLVVRNVQVDGSHNVGAARIRAAARIPPGTPMARLDSGAVARRVEQIPQVRSARVSRSWPDTVVITVQARTPALAVRAAGQFELVDVDGVVVRTVSSRPAGMPVLREPPFQLRGSPAVRAAVLVLNHLPAGIRARVRSVTADPVTNGVTLSLRGGVTVRWGGPGRPAAKARELQALMRTHSRHYDVSSPQVAVTS